MDISSRFDGSEISGVMKQVESNEMVSSRIFLILEYER
jgi:hypothetical protein